MDALKRQQISAIAEGQVLQSGIVSLPVDPVAVAEDLGITVQAKSDATGGASGWLVKSGDNFGILYATHIPNNGFQRFSIGHEIGHYCLPGHPEHVFKHGLMHQSEAGFSSSDLVEIEADYFSASLLMPKSMFRAAMMKSQDGLEAIRALATRCSTSLEATAIRYAELTDAPIAVVVSEGKSVRYSRLSRSFASFYGAKLLLRGSLLPRNSVSQRLACDLQAVSGGAEDSDELDVQDWFTAMRKRPMIEEVVGLGAYGRTLTVLSIYDDPDEQDDDDEDENRRPAFGR